MRHILKSVKQTLSQPLIYFKMIRHCPICGWKGKQFKPGGGANKRRFDCICPKCDSMERHRLAYMVAEKCINLNYSNVIHVAPEKAISTYLQAKSYNYLSIDINPDKAMMKMDVTNLDIEDNSTSLIWASNILEHIHNDNDAISEFYRVLSPKGIAFIQVPIWRTNTLEDFTKSTIEERIKLFYQRDHVRLYGLDIIDKFEQAGFSSVIYRAQDFGPEILLQYGLSFVSTNEVFVFKK